MPLPSSRVPESPDPAPLPLTHEQLGRASDVLHDLVRRKLATYAQLAVQLDVDHDNLKAFCLGRSKRPRDDFVSKFTANIRRIQPFAASDPAANEACSRLVSEISSVQYNRSWYDGWNEFFNINHQAIADTCGPLEGSYAFYRNYGNGRVVLKSRLEIAPFDQTTGVQRFLIRRKVYGSKERTSAGFVVPLHGRIVMIARIADAEGILCIYAERQRDDENMAGVMLSLREGDPSFATRVLMVKLTSKNKLTDANYGLVEFDKLNFELGDNLSTISNQLDQWGVLQTVKL
jgi:hypothetical protein